MSTQTKLFDHVNDEHWTESILRLQTHPNESKQTDQYGQTALHLACNKDSPPIEFINIFLTIHGSSSITTTDNDGDTPLHLACLYSSHSVIQFLTTRGIAALSMKNKFHKTPLGIYCERNHYLIVKTVLATFLPHVSPSMIRSIVIPDDDDDDDDTNNNFVIPTKRFIDTASLLVKATYHNTITTTTTTTTLLPNNHHHRFRLLLHASIGTLCVPPDFCQLVMNLYGEQISEVDEDGNLPLHVAAGTPPSMRKNKIVWSLLGMKLAKEFARTRNKFGMLPFEIACALPSAAVGEEEEEDINMLLAANPAAVVSEEVATTTANRDDDNNNSGKQQLLPLHLVIKNKRRWKSGVEAIFLANPNAIEVREDETRLYPFMIAAVGEGRSLTTVYCLLRACPMVLVGREIISI